MKGYIFDIKRFAVHDGPGIRSTLFLKGCGMRCRWCHNPEGLESTPCLWYFEGKCISCGLCVKSCPHSALQDQPSGDGSYTIRIDRGKCTSCGQCTRECPTGALEFDGRSLDSDEASELLLEDRDFFEASGGGITLSGGDPLLQPEFSGEILRFCQNAGVHTAVETALYCPRQDLESIAPFTDLFICDLKIFDYGAHRVFTGVSNEKILENIRYLALSGKDLLIRIPLIPGITAVEENLVSTGEFLNNLGKERKKPVVLELLNYNNLAPHKYVLRNEKYPFDDKALPFSEKQIRHWESLLASEFLIITSEHQPINKTEKQDKD